MKIVVVDPRCSKTASRAWKWLPVDPINGVTVYDYAGILRGDTIVATSATIAAIEARTGAEIIRGVREVRANMDKIKAPLLILHGTADRLCDPRGSKENHRHR